MPDPDRLPDRLQVVQEQAVVLPLHPRVALVEGIVCRLDVQQDEIREVQHRQCLFSDDRSGSVQSRVQSGFLAEPEILPGKGGLEQRLPTGQGHPSLPDE